MGYHFHIPECLRPKHETPPMSRRDVQVILAGAAILAATAWFALMLQLWRLFIRWVA